MPTMGRYCKAYPIARFEAFPGWAPKIPPADDLPEDERYYFLQEDYTVTRGIFLDEEIVHDAVTDEWKTFCTETLEFQIPLEELEDPSELVETSAPA